MSGISSPLHLKTMASRYPSRAYNSAWVLERIVALHNPSDAQLSYTMFISAVLTTLALAVSHVAAHGGVLSYQINGQIYQGCVAVPLGNLDAHAHPSTVSRPTTPLWVRLVFSANGTPTTPSPTRPMSLWRATPTGRPSVLHSNLRPSPRARRLPRTGSEFSEYTQSGYILTLSQRLAARARPRHDLYGELQRRMHICDPFFAELGTCDILKYTSMR